MKTIKFCLALGRYSLTSVVKYPAFAPQAAPALQRSYTLCSPLQYAINILYEIPIQLFKLLLQTMVCVLTRANYSAQRSVLLSPHQITCAMLRFMRSRGLSGDV